MAQYYQVLSQGEKTVEELRQYYPNIVENQTIQYVISPDEQHQFQGQQILLTSTDQELMVVENQGQQLISYDNQQYVVQDGVMEPQQSIYFMEEVEPPQPDTTQKPQPVVLNHQLQHVRNHLNPSIQRNSVIGLQQRQTQPAAQLPQIQTNSSQGNSTVQQVQQTQANIRQHGQASQIPDIRMTAPKFPNRAAQSTRGCINNRGKGGRTTKAQTMHLPESDHKFSEITESDKQEAIALPDGSVISLADYKKIINRDKRYPAVPPQKGLTSEEHGPKRRNSRAVGSNRGRGRGTKSNAARGRTSNDIHFGGMPNNANNQIVQQQFNPQPLQTIRQTQPQSMQAVQQTRYVQQPPVAINHQQQNMVNQELVRQQALRQQQILQQQNLQQQQIAQPQYIIQPHSHHQAPLPACVASSQIQQIIEQTPLSEEYTDPVRMLVLLENGEQRLITFTVPKEQCTIQEILEQVGVPIHHDTKIACTETNSNGINYVVTVGNTRVHNENPLPQCIDDTHDNENSSMVGGESECSDLNTSETAAPVKPPSPEPPKEVPRYISGKLAVCMHCGYLSEDFNKCLRCKRKLPEDVRSVANTNSNGKKNDLKGTSPEKKISGLRSNINNKSNNTAFRRKLKPRIPEPEPVILTLSSDDEEGQQPPLMSQNVTQLQQKLVNTAVTLTVTKKEPSFNEMQQNSEDESTSEGARGGGKDDSFEIPDMMTTIACRTVRIGSYRYVPNEKLEVRSTGMILKVPTLRDHRDIKTIIIDRKQIVKVLVNFQKVLPVLFYYIVPSGGINIREQLGMIEGNDLYFDPLSTEEAYKRITVLPECFTEDTKRVIRTIYDRTILDELSPKEANDILVKICPRELTKVITNTICNDVKPLLIYPPGKGGLPMNTEDYLCLGQDQFLNDVIIDFYLKYLVLNLPLEQQNKIHIFSTFFYKRLTTKPVKASRRQHPYELDPSLTPSEKRHARVKNWTKHINLFEKDFIIIPINENCHWFLAIICFPAVDGCVTMDGKQIKLEPKQRKKRSASTTIGSVTITAVKHEKEERTIRCDEDEASDRDEAEGDDSELDSDAETDDSEPVQPIEPVDQYQPIKQSCILIFDSLAGASRSRVVATLRDYLTCEYKSKMGCERVYNKDIIKGSCPKVPQQTNFTDCGLYLLQYVEQFFEDPIKDYRLPMKHLVNWFDEFVVTRKREDISLLIRELLVKYNKDPNILPDITFPTLNGKLVDFKDDEEEEECDDDYDMPEEGELTDSLITKDQLNSSCETEFMEDLPICHNLSSVKKDEVLLKPSQESGGRDSFIEQPVTNISILKPDLRENNAQSNRETLTYLKAKRINRHKNNETTDLKKFKSE